MSILYCDSLELIKRNQRVESIKSHPPLNNLGDPKVYPSGLASDN
jgi:hypothetical protein